MHKDLQNFKKQARLKYVIFKCFVYLPSVSQKGFELYLYTLSVDPSVHNHQTLFKAQSVASIFFFISTFKLNI